MLGGTRATDGSIKPKSCMEHMFIQEGWSSFGCSGHHEHDPVPYKPERPSSLTSI